MRRIGPFFYYVVWWDINTQFTPRGPRVEALARSARYAAVAAAGGVAGDDLAARRARL